MNLNILSKTLPFWVLLIAVYSVQRFSSMPFGNTFVYWVIHAVTLLAFFIEARYGLIDLHERKVMRIVKYYLIFNVFSIIRGGLFFAENYWDYKGLISVGMALLLPVFAYVALSSQNIQSILAFYIRYALPTTILVFPFLNISSWGWYLFPIGLLMLFLPALNVKSRILIIFISIIVLLGGLVVRSYLVKFGLPILLLFFYYYRSFPFVLKLMQLSRVILLILPWFFFFFAISGIFNVFNMSEYIESDLTVSGGGRSHESALTDDSRTFLYKEVLESATKYDYWILGRSPARGNETTFFADEMIETVGKPERLKNEAGILNVFTWTGMVGVILIFLVFMKASYIAINKSNNIYIKIIGLFVAFRWVYFWVEDNQSFDMNNLVIWMMIGMCFSESFRNMNNMEIKLWVRGIFSKRFYALYNEYAHSYQIK